MTDGPTRPDLPRTIGFWGASAVMVGIIIGSGIFQTPASIAKELGDPWMILGLWLAGGVLSLFGAFTYAELATMYPQSGGVYVFLREAYGRCMAFVFGWTYMLISKPVAAAGIAIIFATHLNPLLGLPTDPQDPNTLLGQKVTTTVLLTVLTWINARGVALGTGLAGVLTAVKMLALVGIVVFGVALLKGDPVNFVGTAPPKPLLVAIVPVMALVLWTYDGWSDVGSIAGEIRDPQRQLPRIYLTGTAIIIGVYLAVNAVYLYMLPLDEMRATDTVAPLVMDRLLGPAGATAVIVIVLVSTLGSTHGSIMTGARITYAQARDGLLFRFLGGVHHRYQTPAIALWSQLLLSIAALWLLGDFNELAGTFIFTMWIFYGLAGAAIFIFRRRWPERARPYRCWGYPIVPALFVLASAVMTGMAIYESRVNDYETTLPWIAVLIAGVPVYYVWRRLFPEKAAGPT